MQWSDPIRAEEFKSFINNLKEVISNLLLKETKLKMWQKTRMKELHSKKISRKRLRPVSGKLGLTKEDAEQALATKLQKEVDAEKKQIDNNFMKMWRMERDEMHVKGVAARKAEKTRAKQLKELMKIYNSIPHELFQPIPDPEAEWKATNEVWIIEEAKKKAKKNSSVNPTNATNDSEGEEDTTIIVDEESWLQNDFVSFKMDDTE